MNEFIGKWRKFIVEDLYTPNEMSAMSIDKESSSGAFEEGIDGGDVNMEELAAKLQNQLGVKVIPADYDDSVVVIYPDKQPGDDLYNDRMAQKIGLVFEDGVLRLRAYIRL
jgi:hypothetical protein